jgi:hypothetical protein
MAALEQMYAKSSVDTAQQHIKTVYLGRRNVVHDLAAERDLKNNAETDEDRGDKRARAR